jgi:hypothetical protein
MTISCAWEFLHVFFKKEIMVFSMRFFPKQNKAQNVHAQI